ncbi:VOC family protein [Dactylosporangium sp. CA-233914]|uniref:VOC family protein n=1 Tax=Dactylosporangium sp. CA-233914 TaxID=3239934 RepID=UPI003D94CBA1
MSTEGIEAIFLETHNWGRAAKFFQALGFQLDVSAGDGSGVLRNGEGPYLVLVEVPQDRPPQTQIALKVPDADAFGEDPAVEVVTPFEDTHYGTREMTVRDPDGRVWSLQAPPAR